MALAAGPGPHPVTLPLERRLPAPVDLVIPQGRTYRRCWTWMVEGQPADTVEYDPVGAITTRPGGRIVVDLGPYLVLDDDGRLDLDLPPAVTALLTRKCVWSCDLRQRTAGADIVPFLAGKVDVLTQLVPLL